MDTLPRELIKIIMAMIPTDDLVTKFRAVNKQYFSISQSLVSEIGPSFKREQTSNDHQIVVLARDYPSITSLDISKWDLSDYALQIVLTKFPRLKTLRLPLLYVLQGRELLKHKLTSVTSLILEIPSSSYTHWSVRAGQLTSINAVFPYLEHLELRGSPMQTELDNLLKDVTTVKSLVVHGSNVIRISNVPLLTKLTIRDNAKGEIHIDKCPKLETLNIMSCSLTRFDFFQELPSLQHLTVQRGFQDLWEREQILQGEAGPIHKLIKHCPNMKTIRLYRFPITSQELQRLVNELKHLKKIFVSSAKHDESLPEMGLILQEKNPNIEIHVARRKFTTGIDLDVFNNLMKAEKTRDPLVECQHCHLQYQCPHEIHEEVCLKWPAWSCLFAENGCTKTEMTKDELRVHIELCDFNIVKCPMYSCLEMISRHEVKAHNKKHLKTYQFRLKETHMVCPNLQRGCMALFDTPSDKLRHLSKCQQSHCLCMSCKESFVSIDECARHMSECRVTSKRLIMAEHDKEQILKIAESFSKTRNNSVNYSRTYLYSSY